MTTSIEHLDRTRWRELTHRFLDHNYRQIWDFGVACAERVRATSEHVAISDGTAVVGLADVRIKRIPIVRTGIAYINGGPLVREGNNQDVQRLRACLDALSQEYVRRRGLLLRIAPPLGPESWSAAQTEIFTAAGFAPTDRVSRYRTLVLDLSRSLDDIRKGFAQKWRNGLNRSEKNGLAVRSGTGSDFFDSFCGLYDQLLNRKQFGVDLDAGFYAKVQGRLDDGDRFLVSLVEQEGRLVAGHVASLLGDTCVYLLGASNEEGMQSKASYLLQWNVIQTARESGCVWYDLGGINPEANPGVYHFKQGVSDNDVTAPGPFELGPGGIKRYFVLGGEHAFRAIRQRAQPRE